MKFNRNSRIARRFNLLALTALAFTLVATSGAQTFKVLHAFKGGLDGSFPGTPVTLDSAGNIYGQNVAGGIASSCDGLGCGSVWELSPVGSTFLEKTLFDFSNSKTGGIATGRLTFTSSGDLLGVTTFGGGSKTCSGDDGLAGCGEIFQLAPNTSGPWKQSLVSAFNGTNNGAFPQVALVSDGSTGYYGTAEEGGPNYCTPVGSCGLVYHLTPNGSGGWQQTVIFNFPGGVGGGLVSSELLVDAAGNLYGTAELGGNAADCSGFGGCGVVYELSPVSGGTWQETVLYSFTGKADGWNPVGGLVMDAAGNLYGNAESGGNLAAAPCAPYGCGVVFKLAPVSGGGYTQTVLHAFSGAIDGAYPESTLNLDSTGNLYGVANGGGNLNDCGNTGCGVAFKLSPLAGGAWHETELHVFTGGADGAYPTFSLTTDAAGNLYGVAGRGGNLSVCTGNVPNGCGVVFEITP